ncbi:MAG: hypothetical protein ACFFBD_28785 [Candidatus Hodarchaeota archaeon]
MIFALLGAGVSLSTPEKDKTSAKIKATGWGLEHAGFTQNTDLPKASDPKPGFNDWFD